MINWIWFFFLGGGILLAATANKGAEVTAAVLAASQDGITLVIGLAGLMAFWAGLMEIAEASGLTKVLAGLLRPITSRLFPDIPPDHEAMGAIILSMAANILGIGNAATPLGIRAMEKLEELNNNPGTATDSMCTFVAITTSSLTIIPVTVIGMRLAAGSAAPADIIPPTLIATGASTLAAVIIDLMWRKLGQHSGGQE
ncbi:MAG: hypothetical protein GX316_03860 [Firmicutes bacterium]|nr:hypothetical protein [Bacillota bacterium]